MQFLSKNISKGKKCVSLCDNEQFENLVCLINFEKILGTSFTLGSNGLYSGSLTQMPHTAISLFETFVFYILTEGENLHV